MTTATLQVLGDFDVRIEGRSIPLSVDARRLLAFLALRRRPQERGEVIRAIWPCRTTSRGVRDLGRTFDALPSAIRHRIVIDDHGRFGLDADWAVDLDATLESARRLRRGARPSGADLVAFRVDVLPAWSDDWLIDLQERYRRLRLSVLQRVGRQMLAEHRTRATIEVARLLLEEDPLREDAQHLLISALAQSGRHDLAHQQYVRFRAQLRHEWGVAPSRRLHDLVARVHHPAGVAAG